MEYVENPRVYPNTTGEVSFVRARRLVVVAAGSLSSPNILERSGIGAKDVLEKAGIKQVVDLPEVGENYQGELYHEILDVLLILPSDHNIMFNAFNASDDSETIDALVRQTEPEFSSKLSLVYADVAS